MKSIGDEDCSFLLTTTKQLRAGRFAPNVFFAPIKSPLKLNNRYPATNRAHFLKGDTFSKSSFLVMLNF